MPIVIVAKISGVGEAIINDLKVVRVVGLRMIWGELQSRPLLDSWANVASCRHQAMKLGQAVSGEVFGSDHHSVLVRTR